MELSVHRTLEDVAQRLWVVYQRAFDDLRVLAAQRHLMLRGEFDALIADERVAKYVVIDPERDRVGALATMTNDLSAVPLISPDYFAYHFPELYDSGRIWYVSFVAVDPDYQGTGVMGQIIGQLCREVETVGGVICLDICEHRELGHRLPVAIERLADTYSAGIKRRRMDAQVYWAYEFPTPA